MKAGEMRYRIAVYKKPVQDGPYIDTDPSLNLHAVIWAKKEDKIQEERWSGNAVNAIHKSQFIIRWRDDLDESMKVIITKGEPPETLNPSDYEGEILDIVAIADFDYRKQWQFILAGEVENSGF